MEVFLAESLEFVDFMGPLFLDQFYGGFSFVAADRKEARGGPHDQTRNHPDRMAEES